MRSFIVAFFVAAACVPASADNLKIPLNDLGPRAYRLGDFGGLYENGSNVNPADHLIAGLERARKIEPLDENGEPSPAGKIGVITIGNGDTDRVICSSFRAVECEPGSFAAMVRDSARVNPAVVVVNAAHENFLDRDLTTALDNVQRYVLEPAGLKDKNRCRPPGLRVRRRLRAEGQHRQCAALAPGALSESARLHISRAGRTAATARMRGTASRSHTTRVSRCAS